jgi:hypothetical protein
MQRLVFGADDKNRIFIMCYQALCLARAPLHRNELRAHGRLLTKLEAIGIVANPDRGDGEMALYKCPDGGEVFVEGDEYELLKRFLEAFIPDLKPALSRDMSATLEWVDAAPGVSPKVTVENSAPA